MNKSKINSAFYTLALSCLTFSCEECLPNNSKNQGTSNPQDVPRELSSTCDTVKNVSFSPTKLNNDDVEWTVQWTDNSGVASSYLVQLFDTSVSDQTPKQSWEVTAKQVSLGVIAGSSVVEAPNHLVKIQTKCNGLSSGIIVEDVIIK
jgi:hypothetical protein